MNTVPQKNFAVIDAYGFLFRSYYVLPNLTTSYGKAIGGIYGFINTLLKYLTLHSADYVAAVFDTGAQNFRHKVYPQYKMNRPELPVDLVHQFPILREAVAALGIACEEVEGYEADDVIATLSKKYASQDVKINIVTSDKDLLQLLDEHVAVFDPIKSRYLTEEYIQEKFSVASGQLLDLLALAGDAVDNIPGVPGIGAKTAAKLIDRFGSLSEVLSRVEEIEQDRLRRILMEYKDQALLSYRLASLCYDVELSGGLDKYLKSLPEVDKLRCFIEKYELKALVSRVGAYLQVPFSTFVKKTVQEPSCSVEQLRNFMECCVHKGMLAIHVDINESSKKVDGVVLSYDEHDSFRVDTQHLEESLKIVKPVLVLESVLKVVFDAKLFMEIWGDIRPFDDIMLMSYNLDSGARALSFQDIIYNNVGRDCTMSPSCALVLLHKVMKRKLITDGLCKVYYQIERPLVPVLYDMQKVGIEVDTNILVRLSGEFACSMRSLEENIYELAGVRFNIASAKQLGNVLFEHMNIGNAKKLPSGFYATSAEVLEELSADGIEVADKILKWRHFAKLKSTYTDALLKQVEVNTNRVHTSYSMVSTVTGRISSSNPNLQNVPVRSKEGGEIRRAFVAKRGCKLISADYSQIELRIMAHIANVKAFKYAFFHDQDIHLMTAQQIFGNIGPEFRRRAKTINFGIMYGMRPFGLAKHLGITIKDASKYIDQYFASYPEIRDYSEEIKVYAKSHGYTRTIFGRKCFIKGINSSNQAVSGFAERAAVNAPLQGTAADIVKMAMIHIHSKLRSGSILLQVHDELLIEVPECYTEETIKLVQGLMENAVELSVPLKVDVGVGDNWADMTPVVREGGTQVIESAGKDVPSNGV